MISSAGFFYEREVFMKNVHYQNETGNLRVNKHKMSWTLKRSKGESCFGIQGSRIFELELQKDGVVIGKYNRAWEKKIGQEDEEGALALSYILRNYGKEKDKKKKE